MIPFLIGGVLVILFIASRVADGVEEDERREAAGDGESQSWSWRNRVGVMAVAILLMPLALVLWAPEILFTDGWWLWLAGAVAFGTFLVMAALGKAHGDARQSGDDEAIPHGGLGAILRRQMPGADIDPP
jgi:hypothetical protein